MEIGTWRCIPYTRAPIDFERLSWKWSTIIRHDRLHYCLCTVGIPITIKSWISWYYYDPFVYCPRVYRRICLSSSIQVLWWRTMEAQHCLDANSRSRYRLQHIFPSQPLSLGQRVFRSSTVHNNARHRLYLVFFFPAPIICW